MCTKLGLCLGQAEVVRDETVERDQKGEASVA